MKQAKDGPYVKASFKEIIETIEEKQLQLQPEY